MSFMDSGTILTSVIAASAATIGVVVTKDSNISEFRQKWIDALRADVSKLCSVSLALYHANVKYSLRDRVDGLILRDSNVLVDEANDLSNRIRLRLDPKKPKQARLVDATRRLAGLCSSAQEGFDTTEREVQHVLDDALVVIEDAWEDVKRGEPRFRWAFRIALSALVLSLFVAVAHWTGHPAAIRRFFPSQG
jgi:hypothetical protein